MTLFLFLMSMLVGLFTTYVCIHLLKPVALHIGLIDTPGGRKTHAAPVPLIGGIAIFMGFCFSLLCLNISLSDYRSLLAGSGILVLIGVMDDFHELTPRVRLIGQCLATLLLIEWGHLSVVHLGNLFSFGNVNLGMWSLLITIVLVLGFINAINMIDGQDGLAGLVVLGQAFLFACLSYQLHEMHNVYLLILLMSMLCVFLFFNLSFSAKKCASIFMGDAGSTFLGFVIAWFAVDLSQLMLTNPSPQLTLNPITILWVLAYPLFDILSVIAHRLQTRRSPFIASRDHLHYLLLDRGTRPVIVPFFIFALSVGLGLIGLAMAEMHVSEPWQLFLFVAVFSGYFITMTILHKSLLNFFPNLE